MFETQLEQGRGLQTWLDKRKECVLIKKKIVLSIYFGLCWVFTAAARAFSSCRKQGLPSLRCAGFSLQWLLLL